MYFDLYEIHRWHLIEELKSLKNPTRQEITKTYDEEMKNLYKDLDRLKKETQQGYKKEGLKKWNKLIEKQLGVNNFEAFGISEEECQAW
jgi:hypothetical protein